MTEKIQLTNGEAMDIYECIMAMKTAKDKDGKPLIKVSNRLSYAIMRNRKRLEPIYEPLAEYRNLPERYKDYDAERIVLVKKHAVKDEKDRPVINDNDKYDIADNTAFQHELDELKEKYKDAFDELEKNQAEFKEIRKQPCDEYEPLLIDYKDLPEDTFLAFDDIYLITKNAPKE